jgi:hypothetical protein
MRQETIKLELIEWLAKLNDIDVLNHLKEVKDSKSRNKDWWDDLTEQQNLDIQKGLKDLEEGRVVSHDDVMKKYGLLNLLD